MRLHRLLVLLASLLAAAVAAAGAARAEEAIVLDNGAVLRGTAVREDAAVVVFRLSGLGTESSIEIRRDRIVKRFSTDPARRYDPEKSLAAAATPGKGGKPTQPVALAAHLVEPTAALPEEEPQATEEGFVKRLARLAVLALPNDPASRTFLAGLAFVVLLCLFGLGARMADLEGVTLAKSTILASALGGLVAVDVLFYETFLRADRATWVVPVEVAVWVGTALLLTRCGVTRAVQLLAFVVFSGTLVTFAAGAVLVAV